ncbi:MAG TPA: peptide chain release factor N(5)-glutamine methyltransferase, partial [Levilinea sp.]|nr:peptide chain release factor N(5)-glutamine methyltransferase [Levilinea sp.]
MTKPSAWRWPASRTPTTELRAWLAHAYTQLAPVSEDAALEAHLLAAHILEQSRTWIVAHPDAVLEKIHQQQLDSLLERLVRREPLPYLTGKVDFFGMTFEVSPSVLIPRPETELLVDTALTWLRDHPKQRRAVDVGTGSGAIAIALAVHVPDLAVVGVDLSRQALQVARRNIWRHQVSQRVNLVHSDLLAGVCAPFDLLCANLPYIPTQTLASLDVARFEPWMALDGGTDGLRLV